MLWLCARFPLLPLDVFGDNADQASALLKQRSVIIGNAAAKAAGVSPGQSLSTAQSLCPELRCHERDSAREQQHLQQLALWAYHFTPDICLQPPNMLLLEISGSLRLFRGLIPLLRCFVRGLRRRSGELRLGLAHTPLAAELLSHYRGQPKTLLSQDALSLETVHHLLEQLPLRLLPCDQDIKDRFEAMGLKRLGDLQALPSAALNRRFGADFGRLLARITGDQPDPRPRFSPPDVFFSERLFSDVLNNKQQLHFPLSAMLSELEQYLRIKQLINRELHWEFGYSDGSTASMQLHCSHRHFDRRSLHKLTTLKLEHFSLKAPIDRLSLHCRLLEALEPDHQQLFDPAPRDDALSGVIDKLCIRLGADACQYPLQRAEHLPEQAGIYLSHSAQQKTETAEPGHRALRPTWLLPSPLTIVERGEQLYWRGYLELLQGPERIDCGWWQQRQVRDYYIARHENGALCWLYKDCLSQRWFVHGLFG